MKTETRGKTAKERYDKKTAVWISLKLNRKTDPDIIKKLENAENKQGYIKALIRQDLNNQKGPR